MINDLFSKPILIFGCGNTLMGDDGFGPNLIAYLQESQCLPDAVAVLDVGTSIGTFLFDLALAPVKPSHIIILDAAFYDNVSPGLLMELDIAQLTPEKGADFALHQFPAVNLLQELREKAGVGIHILAVQAAKKPDRVQEGLSRPVQQALEKAGEWVHQKVAELTQTNDTMNQNGLL